MPEHNDLALLRDVALSAGEIASGYFGGVYTTQHKPDDAGPVTEADLAVNRMLEDRLRAARPDYGWLSEETEDGAARLGAERVFIVDPIDGTRNFIEGGQTWAHSLAVAERGRVVAAVVYLPMLKRLFAASAGQGATLNDAPLKASTRRDLRGATVLSARPLMEPRFWKGGAAPEFERVYRPSLAYRLALVAQGRYDAMLTLRDSWEWDIAAGALLLEEAGATVSDRSGAPLVFNNARPLLPGVVAAGSGVYGALQGALA
ncbi:3'(2'),5'-bisphosphate nucleotidase CysQ [Rhodobacteraceae bacterium D3-12]|nr:3'(2'),5'-bisphosphate nucleotidase CysQ [Rhodobacteraceae bacterium D3-12]